MSLTEPIIIQMLAGGDPAPDFQAPWGERNVTLDFERVMQAGGSAAPATESHWSRRW